MPVVSSLEKRRPEEKQKKPVEVTFIFDTHGAETADRIVKKIEKTDADVLLLECTSPTEEKKQQVEEKYNLVLKRESDVAPEEAERRDELIREFSRSGFILSRIVWRLAGSGKTVRLIDISGEDQAQAYAEVQAAKEVDRQIDASLQHGNIEWAFLEYKKLIDLFAASSPKRERHVAQQLAEIIPTMPEGKAAAVFQGIAHTATRFHAAETLTDKADIHMELGTPNAIQRPAWRMARLKSALNAKINREDYRWGFLADDIFRRGIRLLVPRIPYENLTRSSIDLAQRLDPEEVEEVYREFSRIYHEAYREYPLPDAALTKTVVTLTKKWAKKKGLQIPHNP